jgi:predicted ATP-binding protein involved in virulence
MIIKQIRLQNFRLFEDITMSFDDRLNVIVGVNGSGKSAFLEGIEVAMYQFYTAEIFNDRIINPSEKEGQISFSKVNSIMTLSLNYNNQVINDKYIEIVKKTNRYSSNISNPCVNMRDILGEINPATNLSLFAFYATDKDKSHFRQGYVNEELVPQADAFQNVFRNDNNAFYSFTNWYNTELNYENSIRLEKDMMYRSPKLQLIRRAFDIFLKAISKDTFKNLRVKLEPSKNFEQHYMVLTITKDGIDIPIDYLSAGEKSVILLVADLVKRLFIANPSLENPLEGTGIILIDEIDLHLHPKWQREVLPALLATFPKLQFIVTTHSPQVLSKIHKQHLFVLKDGQVKRPPSTYGKDTNLILNEAFDISERPDDIKKMLSNCMRLLETEEIEKGKQLLVVLTELLGEDDPEIIHINTFLNMFVE